MKINSVREKALKHLDLKVVDKLDNLLLKDKLSLIYTDNRFDLTKTGFTEYVQTYCNFLYNEFDNWREICTLSDFCLRIMMGAKAFKNPSYSKLLYNSENFKIFRSLLIQDKSPDVYIGLITISKSYKRIHKSDGNTMKFSAYAKLNLGYFIGKSLYYDISPKLILEKEPSYEMEFDFLEHRYNCVSSTILSRLTGTTPRGMRKLLSSHPLTTSTLENIGYIRRTQDDLW